MVMFADLSLSPPGGRGQASAKGIKNEGIKSVMPRY